MTGSMRMRVSLSEVAEKLYTAYNGHDPEAVGRLYHVDGVHEDIAHGAPKYGRAAIVEGLLKFFGWFPDAHWDPQALSGENDGVIAVTYRLTATLQSEMGPVQPRGQSILLRGVHVLRVRNRLISSSEDYWDALTFQRQLKSPDGGNK